MNYQTAEMLTVTVKQQGGYVVNTKNCIMFVLIDNWIYNWIASDCNWTSIKLVYFLFKVL